MCFHSRNWWWWKKTIFYAFAKNAKFCERTQKPSVNGLYIYWFNSFESKCKVLQGKHSNFASECKRFVSKHKISQGITKLEWECITFPQKKCVFTQETAFKGFYKQTVFCCLFCFLVRMQKCLEILHAKTLKLHFSLYFLHLRCCIETLLKSWTWEIYLHNSQKMLFAGNHVYIYIYAFDVKD